MPFTAVLVMSNLKMFRYEWIAEKSMATGFLNAKRMPLKCHENICVFYKKLPTYNAQMTKGNHITSNVGIVGHSIWVILIILKPKMRALDALGMC